LAQAILKKNTFPCAMNDAQASHHAFMLEGANAVIKTASTILDMEKTAEVQVVQLRRGWEIVCNLAEEHEQPREILLDAAKASLQTATQSAQHVCLLGHGSNPYKDVRHGFRCLLAHLQDPNEACVSMYGFGSCPRGVSCQFKHPAHLKRLYVVVRTGFPAARLDTSDSVCEGETSVSSSSSCHQLHSNCNSSSSGSTDGLPVHSYRGSPSLQVALLMPPPGLIAPAVLQAHQNFDANSNPSTPNEAHPPREARRHARSSLLISL